MNDAPSLSSLKGPGLAKTRGYPLIATRTTLLARATDARWASLFERADIISEGAARHEDGNLRWYGSTSVLLPQPLLEDTEASLLLRVASHDVHVRLRAVRLAHREASVRAPWPLGRASCELRFQLATTGVRIDVDVEAPLLEERENVLLRSDGPP